jgi:hypothetical protein
MQEAASVLGLFLLLLGGASDEQIWAILWPAAAWSVGIFAALVWGLPALWRRLRRA